MSNQAIEVNKSIVHAIFECRCGKQWDNYLTAQKLAAAHAIKSGHTVNGEIGYAVQYKMKKI